MDSGENELRQAQGEKNKCKFRLANKSLTCNLYQSVGLATGDVMTLSHNIYYGTLDA